MARLLMEAVCPPALGAGGPRPRAALRVARAERRGAVLTRAQCRRLAGWRGRERRRARSSRAPRSVASGREARRPESLREHQVQGAGEGAERERCRDHVACSIPDRYQHEPNAARPAAWVVISLQVASPDPRGRQLASYRSNLAQRDPRGFVVSTPSSRPRGVCRLDPCGFPVSRPSSRPRGFGDASRVMQLACITRIVP